MPKHKKTREQKKRADARQSLVSTSSGQENLLIQPSYTFSSQEFTGKTQARPQHSNNSVRFIRRDLLKTLWISLIIVALQFLFYFLLRNHVLAINFVRY